MSDNDEKDGPEGHGPNEPDVPEGSGAEEHGAPDEGHGHEDHDEHGGRTPPPPGSPWYVVLRYHA